MGDPGQMDEQTLEIPAVPMKYFGLLANIPDIDPSSWAKSIWHLSELYGPIYSFDIPPNQYVVITDYDLVRDSMDDTRFEKVVDGALIQVRNMIGDGLFTAFNEEENWAKAHRILMPVFGPIAVRRMFDQQLDIASQMILRFDRMGPNHRIPAADDFTRLAFDTIGFCAFSYRFNDFYSDNAHPFVNQMVDALIESGKRGGETSLQTKMRYFANKKYWEDIKGMQDLCHEVIDDRTKNPQPEVHDLLNVMLNTEDPETKTKLDADNIMNNMATFLVAGHETTSGTLCFLWYNLLKNPETYIKAQKQVDEVIGDKAVTVEHLSKLTYIDACVKETLRYMGPIWGLRRHPKNKGEKLGGKYPLKDNATVFINLKDFHHDPKAWGDDANVFNPERWIPAEKLPRDAFIPFGVGIRSCIGRAFAEQEIMLTMALMLQRFQVELADPDYVMKVKSTLTIKPDALYLRVRRRPGKSDMVGLQSQGTQKAAPTKHGAAQHDPATKKSPLTILYASNAGTCKAYSEDLLSQLSDFDVKMETLDAATEHVPKDQPVVIITPSYEGLPADNARKFVTWLTHQSSPELFKGVNYVVFGVGNSEWQATYQKIPKLVDEHFAKLGATRIADAQFADVKYDPAGPWDTFVESLLPKLGQATNDSQQLSAEITASDSADMLGGQKMLYGTVISNIDLADDSVGPPKKHIDIELPEGTSYRTGDYLAILAFNHRDTVSRVLRRFSLKADDNIMIKTNKAFLKTNAPTSVFDILTTRVELNTPITQKQLIKLASLTKDEEEAAAIERLAQDDVYQKEVLHNRISVLDILEDHPAISLDFVGYLDLLKGLACRQYSISSSPLATRNFGTEKLVASLSYDVHSGGEHANHQRPFHGVASSYLADLSPGTRLHVAVKSTNAAFHLPKDLSVPVIMIAAGTGLAPMRGFLEERAAIASTTGRKLGPALLYYGCRDFEKDYIYKNELEEWEKLGVVSLRPVFSKRWPEGSSNTWKYVPDRMWDERNEVADLFHQGGKIFLCGSASKLAKSCAEVCKKIYKERTGKNDAEADAWLDTVKEDRYVSDVFG